MMRRQGRGRSGGDSNGRSGGGDNGRKRVRRLTIVDVLLMPQYTGERPAVSWAALLSDSTIAILGPSISKSMSKSTLSISK